MRLWLTLQRATLRGIYWVFLPVIRLVNRWSDRVIDKPQPDPVPDFMPDFEPSSLTEKQIKVVCAVCNYQFEAYQRIQVWTLNCPFCESKSIMLLPVE